MYGNTWRTEPVALTAFVTASKQVLHNIVHNSYCTEYNVVKYYTVHYQTHTNDPQSFYY